RRSAVCPSGAYRGWKGRSRQQVAEPIGQGEAVGERILILQNQLRTRRVIGAARDGRDDSASGGAGYAAFEDLAGGPGEGQGAPREDLASSVGDRQTRRDAASRGAAIDLRLAEPAKVVREFARN